MKVTTKEQAEEASAVHLEDIHQISFIYNCVNNVIKSKDLAESYMRTVRTALASISGLLLICGALEVLGVRDSESILMVGISGALMYTFIPAGVVLSVYAMYALFKCKQSAKGADMSLVTEMLTEERLNYIYQQVTAPKKSDVRSLELVDWVQSDLIDLLIAVKIAKGYKYELPQGAIGKATAHALNGGGVICDSYLYKDFFVKALGDYNSRLKAEVACISEELSTSMAFVAGDASFGATNES